MSESASPGPMYGAPQTPVPVAVSEECGVSSSGSAVGSYVAEPTPPPPPRYLRYPSFLTCSYNAIRYPPVYRIYPFGESGVA